MRGSGETCAVPLTTWGRRRSSNSSGHSLLVFLEATGQEPADVLCTDTGGGDLGQETVHGCGARRTEERHARLVDPCVVPVIGSPALVGVKGDAPAETTFEHRRAR